MFKPTKEGRRRLRAVLSFLFGVPTTLVIVLVLIGYKAPYNPIWWLVLGVIVLGAFAIPLLLVPAIEWVMEGYSKEDEKS